MVICLIFQKINYQYHFVSLKIHILKKENSLFEIALLSHLVLNIGLEHTLNTQLGSVNRLCFSHPSDNKLSLGYNIGYNYFGVNTGDLTYSIVLGIGVNNKLSLYIEPYGDFIDMEDHLASINMGATYLLKDNFQLDCSFGTGLNYNTSYTAVGFSWYLLKD